MPADPRRTTLYALQHFQRRLRHLGGILLILASAACATHPRAPDTPAPVPAAPSTPAAPPPPSRIALVLGGGAAKGFAHIGVIKALDAQGLSAQIVVGTSAGSVVGALYAGGLDGFALQRLALDLKESVVSDWTFPERGFLKGQALAEFINRTLANKPMESLPRTLAVVATDLQSGEAVSFQRGDTGMAVRASSSVPGVFQPVRINGRDYVDGGLVSPVPVRVARRLGAEIVIATDIGSPPEGNKVSGTLSLLLQSLNIMGRALANEELMLADVVVRPDVSRLRQAAR